MQVVVDTNVFVSSFLTTQSPPRQILTLFFDRRIHLLVNPPILEEYRDVLSRKEFGFGSREVGRFFNFIRNYSIHVPYFPVRLSLPHEGDLPFVLCARQGKADCLITGNKKHFPETVCKGFSVMTPHEFIRRFI